jgi:FlgD Ig-like domain
MNNTAQQQGVTSLSTSASGNGAVMIVGIDTETGRRPGDVHHGEISYWANVIQTGLLAFVSNGKTDILVVGGHGHNSDVKDFWTQVGTALNLGVTFKHRDISGTGPIRNVNFSDFALLVVATDDAGKKKPSPNAKGALQQDELDALNNRQSDVTDFLCKGGALFASSCHLTNPYAYISKFGNVGISETKGNGANPTAAGIAVGLGVTDMPDGPWHIQFTSFPGYLKPLSTDKKTSNINAIGGINLSQLSVELSFPKSEYCLKDPILADTTGSVGAAKHFWSIQESDVNWNRFGEEISEWFDGSPTNINLSDFAKSKNLTLKCHTYYRIKLALAGLCTEWLETTRLIRIICPEVDAGPDKCVACDGGTASLGLNKVDASIRYQWMPAIGLNQADIANPVHQNYTGKYPITYTVTATDLNGCSNSDEVTLFCKPPTLELTMTSTCCEVHLKANGQNYSKIEWSTGEAGVDEISTTRSGEFTVTATNACGSVSQSIKSDGAQNMRGEFNTVKYDGVFFPPNGDSNFKNKLYIIDILNGNGVQGTPNSYNASQYKIEIRNRWGILIKTIESSVSCAGFNNWDVSWDGTTDQGDLVEHGAYYFLLWFKNCDYADWTHPKVRTWIPTACIKWFTLFGKKLWCTKHDPAGPTASDILMTSGVVNVWYP